MDRRRGFMKKEKVFRLLDEVAEKRSWLGPLFPVKLHQMGEPMLHPDLVEIVERAEERGVPIELNTNCGLITAERVEGLYRAGLTNLILSYQTPDPESFKTRKAPRLVFDEYRDKVRLARGAQGGARRAHEPRDRHHEHEVRGRLPHRERGRAGARLPRATGSRSPRTSSAARPRAARARLGADPRRALPRPGRERQPLHAARRRAPHLEALPHLGQRDRRPPRRHARRRHLLPGAATTSSWCSGTATWSPAARTTRAAPRPRTCSRARSRPSGAARPAENRKRDMLEGRLLDVCAKCIGVK